MKQSIRELRPFPIHSIRKVVEISGDLHTMCDNWTPKEMTDKRRLVEFQRVLSGNTIIVLFKSVSPEKRSPINLGINCYLWEKENQWFTTTIEVMTLVEALIGLHFTVQEKACISNVLQPFTVSKATDKANGEYHTILDIILGFLNPKTRRRCKKDINIFNWHNLALALNKIIEGYVGLVLLPV